MTARTSTNTFTKTNPATGEPLETYTSADADQVAKVVEQSHAVKTTWASTPLKKRAQVLNAIAKRLQQDAEPLAQCISKETGKPIPEAYETELVPAVSILSYYARQGPKTLRDTRMPLDKSLLIGRTHVQRYFPYGVVGIVSPWNFPLATPFSGIASSLMAGNTVILKPSELTPETGIKLVDSCRDIFTAHGLPADIIQCLIGDGKTGQVLCDADINHLIFTGSTSTGQRIRTKLDKRNIPCSLELGGSDPMIILSGADLDAATSYAVWGRFTNAGQLCAAVKRLIVPKAYYEKTLSLLQEKAAALVVDEPANAQSQMGPLISKKQRDELLDQVTEAVEKGARVITGGNALEKPGFFMAPTILADVFLNSRVMQEEVFGPVLPVVSYENIDEAIYIANNTPYGLTASIFGNIDQAQAVSQLVHAGCVVINDVGATSYAMPLIPWRGWKSSGPGGSHGIDSLLELSRRQTLTINWLERFPLFKKQFWHFDKGQDNRTLGKTLLTTYATESWLDKCSTNLLSALWKNRSDKKL